MQPYNHNNLLLAIGNSSRGDDGLGWAFLERIAEQIGEDWTAEQRYQLQVEDAEMLTHFQRILFVDATLETLPDGFALAPCIPNADAGPYSHQQTPGAVLFLCQTLYGHAPEAFVLKITGYQWDLGAGMSPSAVKNLDKALKYFATRFLKHIG